MRHATGTLRAMRRVLPVVGFVGSAALLFPSAPGSADQAPGKGYLPGLGDLMNASMQVHHLKLWFAGHADNWPLAAYELKEIRETMDDIADFAPTWHNVPVGQMVKTLDTSLDHLDAAIKAKDPTKFDTAFHELTETCNACHGAAGQPEIVITEPPPQGGGSFANQEFTRGKGPQ
jgi:hypothetical protein